MSADVPERRGSRSAKRRLSSKKESLLPLDLDVGPITTEKVPSLSPKQIRLNSIQRAVKRSEQSDDDDDEYEISEKKPSKPVVSASQPLKVKNIESPSQRLPTPSMEIDEPVKRKVDQLVLDEYELISKPKTKRVEEAKTEISKKVAPKLSMEMDAASKRKEDQSILDEFEIMVKPEAKRLVEAKVEKQRAPLPMPVLMVSVDPVPVTSQNTVISEPKGAVVVRESDVNTVVSYSEEPFFAAKEPSSPRPRVLFALTGSVATIKLNEVLTLLTKTADVIVITTKSAQHFIANTSFDGVRFYNDVSEYAMWKTRNDPVLHIELRKWADIFLIAPLSANSLAKLANGLCDNLVTSVARAWDFERPFYIAPAMNTLMWTHPFTQKHLKTLEEIGVNIIHPIQKTLMCGDVGTKQLFFFCEFLNQQFSGNLEDWGFFQYRVLTTTASTNPPSSLFTLVQA